MKLIICIGISLVVGMIALSVVKNSASQISRIQEVVALRQQQLQVIMNEN